MKWVLTCEHFSNAVPPAFEHLFARAGDVLNSHRGYDIDVAALFEQMIPGFDSHFHYPWTRLLIEPNRSLRHRHLFSPFSLQLSVDERQNLISRYYQPYRKEVDAWIRSNIKSSVVHISAHTFTPQLGNEVRQAEIGVLFDPGRAREKEFAVRLKQELARQCEATVRFNYPYRGVSDGFTTYLRKVYPTDYIGIELEVRNNEVARLKSPIAQAMKAVRQSFV